MPIPYTGKLRGHQHNPKPMLGIRRRFRYLPICRERQSRITEKSTVPETAGRRTLIIFKEIAHNLLKPFVHQKPKSD
jgi:hypothetical protein